MCHCVYMCVCVCMHTCMCVLLFIWYFILTAILLYFLSLLACLCPLSMEAVIEFSSEMTPRWEAIGHGLSIGSSTIQSLRNHPCSQDSKCIQMLEKWFENGIDVSWERLFSVLRGQKMMSLISAMSRRAKS